MPSSRSFILWNVIPMLVVGCSRHHLNSLTESFSSWLMKSSCRGKPQGSLLCPRALPTLRGSEMMSFFLSDPGVGGGGMDSLSARGLSALIKRSVFRRISWFLPRGQDFSGSECAGCCAGRREDPPPIQLKAALETLMRRGENPRIMQGTNTSPQVLFPSVYSPPTPFPFFLSGF